MLQRSGRHIKNKLCGKVETAILFCDALFKFEPVLLSEVHQKITKYRFRECFQKSAVKNEVKGARLRNWQSAIIL